MEILVRHTSAHFSVKVCEDQTTIDLGLLNESERDDLAQTLLEAVYDMGPHYNNACDKWFAQMLKRCKITLPDTETLRRQAEVYRDALDGIAGGTCCGRCKDDEPQCDVGRAKDALRTVAAQGQL